MKIRTYSMAGVLAAVFSASALAEPLKDQNYDSFVIDNQIIGPFPAAQECVENVMKDILGPIASVTPKYPRDSDNIYIDGYSLPTRLNSPRQIFVTLNDGQVTQLGVNFDGNNPEYLGWADIYYGPRSSVIRIDGAQRMEDKPAQEVRDFITRVDSALRSCGSIAAAAPAFRAA